MVDAQSLEASLYSVEQMPTRGTCVVRPLAHRAEGLGRNQVAFTRHAEVPKGFAEETLRSTEGVHVRRVEQIHSGLESFRHQCAGILLSLARKRRLTLHLAKCHGSEAQLGHEQAGSSKSVIFHMNSPVL
jgi:hypothetical protein